MNQRNYNLPDETESDIFSGVTDTTDEDDISVELNSMIKASKRPSHRRLRIHSAPIRSSGSRPTSSSASRPLFRPTIVQPFKMTKREEEKAREKEILRKMLEESNKANNEDGGGDSNDDDARRVHFKAKPVPDHVRKPLFRNMLREQPSRYNIGPMMAKLQRANSVPNFKSGDNDDDLFRARPFPHHIFTDFAYEQIKENQRYRDVRKALRQKTLLKQAKYPPRMEQEGLRIQSAKASVGFFQ